MTLHIPKVPLYFGIGADFTSGLTLAMSVDYRLLHEQISGMLEWYPGVGAYGAAPNMRDRPEPYPRQHTYRSHSAPPSQMNAVAWCTQRAILPRLVMAASGKYLPPSVVQRTDFAPVSV